jgi:nitrogen-specific signal transduction histidine kinase
MNDDSGDPRAELRALRSEIRRLCHDIQNPVAIISGNAQLLAEIARGLGLPDEVRLPITDLVEANQLLAERVEQLRVLGSADGL